MTHFEEHFIPQDIDQQLEQPRANTSEQKPETQLLAELHTFHHMAARAEKQSIALAWERIERQRFVQEKSVSEKSILPFYNRVNKSIVPIQFSPRARKKRGFTPLVAILVALLLIGGITLALVQKSAPTTSSAPGKVPTPTPQTLQNKTGTLVYTHKEVDNGMVLAWSPDSKRLLSARSNVDIWDAITGLHPFTYHPITQSIPVQNAAWAPDNSQRVAIADGTHVQIVDANTGAVLLTGPKSSSVSMEDSYPANPLSQGIQSIRALAWSPDGNEIASSISLFNPPQTARPITIWNSHTGAIIKQLIGHTDDVYQVSWSPNGKYLASVAQSQDNTVRVWNVASGTSIYTVHPLLYGAMQDLAWSPNGQYLAVQMVVQVGTNTTGPIITRNEIQIWKALTHTVLTKYTDLLVGYGISGFSWAPDSTHMIVAIEGTPGIHMWNALTGQILSIYQGKHQEIASQIAWSPNGKYIALATSQISGKKSINVTEVWDAPDGI